MTVIQREYIVPYQLELDRLRAKLNRTRNQEERETIEFCMVVLLGLMDALKILDELAAKTLEKVE